MRGGPVPAPNAVYAAVLSCLQSLGIAPHRTAQAALAGLVSALLLGQSLRPSLLARALPSPQPVPARERYRQVARAWDRPWLTAAHLTTALTTGVLALAQPTAPLLVLDSLRCGPWEVFTVGLTFHGRVLPLRWALLPYPWPKGQFTPTVCALLRQVAAAWPANAPVPHLVADRAFPSTPLVTTLEALGWDYTLRLRAADVVTTATGVVQGYDLLATAVAEDWTVQPGRFGRHADAGPRSRLVVGRGLTVLPHHQRDAGSARHRARRRAQRLHGVKQTRRAAPTEPWLILLTTAPTWRAAVRAYSGRYHTEGSYRDAQTGWDGRHGWDLGERLATATTAQRGDALVGLWALGTLLQSWLGDQLTATTTAPAIRAVAGEWTVHGRLSVWARGRLALTDGSGRLGLWIPATLRAAAGRFATAHDALTPPRLTKVA
jgi:hypothetical protein